MPEFNLSLYVRIPDDDDETLTDIRRRATIACEDVREPVPNDVAEQFAAILNWGDTSLPAAWDGALVAVASDTPLVTIETFLAAMETADLNDFGDNERNDIRRAYRLLEAIANEHA